MSAWRRGRAYSQDLVGWVTGLITASGYAATPGDERRNAQGVRTLLRLPPEHRSLSELRAFLGQQGWTSGAPVARSDGPSTASATTSCSTLGFGITALLDDQDVRGPAMAYLFHRVEELVDGRRLVVAIDEFWKGSPIRPSATWSTTI
jgi:type IV secretion system protein VirB4